jgi:hypothetical protein
VLKTMVFSLATVLFLLIEELVRLARYHGGFAAAWERLSGDFVWSIFWIRDVWIFILVLLYCAGSELTRVIGKGKVAEIFFGSRKK